MYNMMQELINRNEKIAIYYAKAKVIWESIDILDENLNKIICSKQSEFERLCKDRNLGQEIMVYSGIIYYISDDKKLAASICNALINSSCSNEAKQYARDAKQYFNL